MSVALDIQKETKHMYKGSNKARLKPVSSAT